MKCLNLKLFSDFKVKGASFVENLLWVLFALSLTGCVTPSTFNLEFDRVLEFSSEDANKRQQIEIVIPDNIPPSPELQNNIERIRDFYVQTFKEEAKKHYNNVFVVKNPSNSVLPRIELVAGSGFFNPERLSTNFNAAFKIYDKSGNPHPIHKIEIRGQGIPVANSFEARMALGTSAVTQPMTNAADQFIRAFRDQIIYSSSLVENGSTAYASNKAAPSSAASVTNTYREPERSVKSQHANSWALVVGISKYKSSQINNLAYADSDAEAFYRELHDLGWAKNKMKLLTNNNATKQNIQIALESWLTQAAPDDLILLFWAGHGLPDPANMEHVYFACFDTNPNIPVTGYRMDRVVNSLKERNAKNVVVLADTCHAGKLATRGERGLVVKKFFNNMKRRNEVAKGWIFMTGASTEQEAVEHPAWSNGVFTYCLLKGLKGEADGMGGRVDGIITFGELKDYLREKMPSETRKVMGVAKHPTIVTTTGDVDIWNLSLDQR